MGNGACSPHASRLLKGFTSQLDTNLGPTATPATTSAVTCRARCTVGQKRGRMCDSFPPTRLPCASVCLRIGGAGCEHAGDRERERLWEVAGPTLTLGKPWCAAASRLRRRQTDTTPRKAGHMNRAFSNTKCLELLEIECSQSENGTLQCGAGPEWHGKPFFLAGHQRLDTCRCPLVASQQKTAKHQMPIDSARSVS